MDLDTTSDLLIGQWQDSPRLRAAVNANLGASREVLSEYEQLRLMREIDTAEGVWLDYLGRRVGIGRPGTRDPAQDERFGFDQAGEPFDQAPFRGEVANDAVYPLLDDLFRRLIRARAVLVLGDGTFQTFQKAARTIDPGATVRDQRNMTIRIVTDQRALLQLADSSGALPRTAGVKIEYADRGRFGFDAAGVPFDSGPFTSV